MKDAAKRIQAAIDVSPKTTTLLNPYTQTERIVNSDLLGCCCVSARDVVEVGLGIDDERCRVLVDGARGALEGVPMHQDPDVFQRSDELAYLLTKVKAAI